MVAYKGAEFWMRVTLAILAGALFLTVHAVYWPVVISLILTFILMPIRDGVIKGLRRLTGRHVPIDLAILISFVILIVIVVMMMVAAAAMIVAVLMIVMVLVLLFLILVGVLLVGLGSHSDQLSLEVVLGGHGLQDLLAGQGVPGGGDDGSGGVLLTQHGHSGGDLFLGGVLGAAQDDAACVADLVVVELTEVLHIHLDLVDVGHGNEAAQLNIQMLGHALDSAGHVGQLADAGGLDDDAVRVVLLHHLLQSGAEIAHQRAADAAGVQLIDLDAGLL